MPWYKVTLAYKDCGIGGKGQQLQDAFTELLIQNGGQPWDAALFSQRSDDFESVFYYFSPSTPVIAKSMIDAWGAVPCPTPTRGPLLKMATGDARAWDMLFPTKKASI